MRVRFPIRRGRWHGAQAWQMVGARHTRSAREERAALRVAPLPPRKRAAHLPSLPLRAVQMCWDEGRPDTSTQRARRAASNKGLGFEAASRAPRWKGPGRIGLTRKAPYKFRRERWLADL